MLSIVVAGGLLLALLLMSGNPNQSLQRSIDAEMRYLADLDALLDETIEVTWASKADTKGTLNELADRYELIIKRLGDEIAAVYAPAGLTGELRNAMRNWFGGFSRDHEPQGDAALALYTRLNIQTIQLSTSLRTFADKQSQLVASMDELERTGRELVSALRSRGNPKFADALFSAEQAVLDRLAGRDLQALQSITGLLSNVRTPDDQLTLADREALTLFANTAESASELRRGMLRNAQNMELHLFSATRAQLQDTLAAAYVQGLFAVNDARVLLNVYTGMLLLVLGYFGVRLGRSHKELNKSHAELENRVQERTEELELAMSELQESQVQLVQAEKMSSLGQLVAGVMHEINTPLLYVLNNTSMTAQAITEMEDYMAATMPLVEAQDEESIGRALRHLDKKRHLLDTEIISENAQEISVLSRDSVEGLDQISGLVQSLKDFSRLDRAAEDRFSVIDGIEKTLVITRNLWKYGIEIEKDFQDVPDIFCSPSRLNQVFINLITNAVQAMDGEGKLFLGISARGDWVEVTVQDTGCGIPEENLGKIMDPFFTTKPVGKGTGLGLSIIHQIVEEHEGQLLVDSKEEVGTRFTLGLPVRRSGSNELEKTDKKSVSVVGSNFDDSDQLTEQNPKSGDSEVAA